MTKKSVEGMRYFQKPGSIKLNEVVEVGWIYRAYVMRK